jgi:hypothetical protein
MTRDAAEALVASLGGRSTSAISGKTTMLVLGRVLEDGRPVEAGSKFREAAEQNAKAAAGDRPAGPLRVLDEAGFIAHLDSTLPVGERALFARRATRSLHALKLCFTL